MPWCATASSDRRPERAEKIVAFDLRGPHRPGPSGGPLAVICGLPVLIRNLLLVERRGFGRALLLVEPSDKPLVTAVLAQHSRVGIAISWIEDLAEAGRSGAEVWYWPADVTCGLSLPEIGDPIAAGIVSLRGPAIRSAADRATAAAGLIQSLRKNVDGTFSRNFNRRVSLAISSRLAEFSVSPHTATMVAGIVGMASGIVAARGGYVPLLVGALLYLTSNVLDGVDGELARVKLLQSRFGEWLDTVADDLTNMSFCVGTAVGCYLTWPSDIYLILAAVIAVGLLIVTAVMYRYLITVAHSGDLNAFQWPWERSADAPSADTLGQLKFLLKRDAFAYMAVLTALVGQAWIAVWLAAIGTTALWVTWAVYSVRMPKR